MESPNKCERKLRKRKGTYNGDLDKQSISRTANIQWDFSKPTDVVLKVEGKQLHVHKDLLVKSSPVFKVMLESDHFIEKQNQEIKLPNKKADKIQEMLNFLYPFNHEISDKNVESMLKLSHEYQIDSISHLCESFLLTKTPSVHTLVLAQEYGLSDLKKRCIAYFGEAALYSIERQSDYIYLTMDTIEEISRLRYKTMKSFVQRVVEITKETERPITSPFSQEHQCTHVSKGRCKKALVCCNPCRRLALCAFIKTETLKLGAVKEPK